MEKNGLCGLVVRTFTGDLWHRHQEQKNKAAATKFLKVAAAAHLQILYHLTGSGVGLCVVDASQFSDAVDTLR